LLIKKTKLLEFDSKLIQKVRRSQFRTIITSSNFEFLGIYHQVLNPFAQAVKFFERAHVTLCHVYHTLKTLKEHFRQEETSNMESNPDYSICCSTVLSIIRQRHNKLLDISLVKAAFWLTSFGCQSLEENKFFIPPKFKLKLTYHPPFSPQYSQGPFDNSLSSNGNSQETYELVQSDVDGKYTGDVIMEDELEEVPTIGSCKNKTLPFLIELLHVFMLEDLDREIPMNVSLEVRQQVEETLQYFFCNPESISKCRNYDSEIELQVELWHWMKYNAGGRIHDQFVAKVISILSIPASEASCELC
jgi:hypothetical protein